jgi:hypothetical protein
MGDIVEYRECKDGHLYVFTSRYENTNNTDMMAVQGKCATAMGKQTSV